MTITETPASDHKAPENATDLVDRLFEATIGTLELFSVHIGTRLGLYETIDRAGTVTEASLAAKSGINWRYSREWLEQQTVAGFLTVDNASAEPDQRDYRLPAEHRGVLINRTDPEHIAPFAPMIVGIANTLDEVIDAYRTGSGVPYTHYGCDFRHGQGGINRPAFTTDLVTEWLPAVRGVTNKLAAGGRYADLGTGHGWAPIAVKATFPESTVLGIDRDEASIIEAADHASAAGVEVTWVAADADSASEHGPFDVVTVLETLHDMARPVEVLTHIREALADDGIVVIADEAVAETFNAPGDELERMMYGWSVSHCLPVAMAEQPSAAIGTVIRPSTVAELAAAAGYSSFELVDVDGGFFNIYRLAT